MSDLLAARLTMALSLGFHIVLAAIGMVLPWLMVFAHRRWLRTGEAHAYQLTRAWMRGAAIFFATGAVSGTALSFELGILWPEFMRHAGPIIGMPFSLEGTAFFIEAIALGIYMYGWERISPRLHWWTGVAVGVAGVSSGILVVSANGWMNSPSGFDWVNGRAINVDPWAALFNPAWATQATHMVVGAFEAVAFAAVGVHAFLQLRGDRHAMHALALRLSLGTAAIAAVAQPMVGHWAAQDVAHRQPAKLAAMESHFRTSRFAPLMIGGVPDEDEQVVRGGLEVPGALSFLAHNDAQAEVIGLDAFPKEDWPPLAIVHIAFQLMVAIGTWLALLGLTGAFAMRFRPKWLERRWLLRIFALSAPLGFLAIEAGWVVTEVGRQPWIIYGIMRTEQAVTPVPGQVWHLAAFATLYALIGLCAVWMWRRQVGRLASLGEPSNKLQRWAGRAA